MRYNYIVLEGIMKTLKERIVNDGYVIGDDILKVDSFINHQVDTKLLDELGAYFRLKFDGVTKILTIESSGIAFGVGVASHFGYAPMVFAKKSKSKILDEKNLYTTVVDSFTKGTTNVVSVDKRFLTKDDKCLIVDDFMAEGNAALGLVDLCNQAGATVVGVAIVIEKGFQGGRKRLEEKGIRVESAAIVDHFENGKAVLR